MEKQLEKILAIIEKNISTYQLKDDSDPIFISGKEDCAKEIAALYEGWYPGGFVVWKDNITADFDVKSNEYYVSFEEDLWQWLTIDELFGTPIEKDEDGNFGYRLALID